MPGSDAGPSPGQWALRRGGVADLPFVMSVERLPGYDELVAAWSREQHEAAIARADVRYLIGTDAAGRPNAFTIVEHVDDPHEGAKLKRIAVIHPGQGIGTTFVEGVIDWVFGHTQVERVWLDVFAHNERARHVYRRVGLREDGLLRQAYVLPDGRRVDRWLMSVLRREWRDR